MPNRIVRDGFVDSSSICALNDWPHRVYSNLVVKVDDAGRQDARLELLRSLLFPLGLKRRTEDLRKALTDLEKSRLSIFYEVNSKPYLQLTKWQRCGSAATSRFPWRDGSFDIKYVTINTRDGPKEFVASSVEKQTGLAPPPHGVNGESDTKTKTNYEDGDVLRKRTRSAHNQAEVLELCADVLGKDEMARYGTRWRKRAEEIPDQIHAVLSEVRGMRREGRVKTTNAKAAEDLLKRGFGA